MWYASYYDFLRLRNLYKNVENIKFLSKYTIKSNEIKYRRGFGNENDQNIMYLVMTERYYFYKKLKCKSAQRVLFTTKWGWFGQSKVLQPIFKFKTIK